MKVFIAALMILVGVSSAQTTTRFVSDPSVSPDGNTVVFVYQGDLWTVSSEGGSALRLTAMNGQESLPRFSPDGRWLAFTSTQSGNPDVYVLPLEGGPIQRLTYHAGSDLVDSWSWDNKSIVFTSSRYNSMSGYRVPIAGGTPVRLFDHYFNRPHHVVQHPETGDLFFTDTWESFSQAQRKRYRGSYNPDLQTVNPATREYKVLTNWEGKDMWPTIDRKGTVYFVSDEYNGQYNLYRLDGQNSTRLTEFATSIERPQVSADGSLVVFVRDYALYAYEPSTATARPIPVYLAANTTLDLEKSFNVNDGITGFDVSPDKEKMAFVSRGELFVSDPEGKFVRQIPTQPDGRVVEVKWLADNRTLLFNQTVDGYLNWFTVTADGTSQPIARTTGAKNSQSVSFDPELEFAVYQDGRDELKLLNLKTFGTETIVRDEFWSLYPTSAMFSPDGKWIAYSAYREFETDIFVYSRETKTSTNITHSAATENGPFWSADGKYLYLTADRTGTSYPRGDVDPAIYRLALRSFSPELRNEKFDALFTKPDSTKTSDSVRVTIALESLDDRWERVVSYIGSQGAPYVITKKETQTILYVSNHDKGQSALWKTVLEPFEAPKTEKIDGPPPQQLVTVGDQTWALARGKVHKLNLSGNKLEPVAIDFPFARNLRDEFDQMFFETWANIEENYYDGTFHGVDWVALRDQYAAFLPFVGSRADLRRLLNDLLGELNSSHMGFNSNGPEENTFYSTSGISTGLLFEENNPFQVSRIVNDSWVDKTGLDLRPGDILSAVDGKQVDPTVNREQYFALAARPEEMKLTFKRASASFDIFIKPESTGQLSTQLYDEWVDHNQSVVDQVSDRKIAYIHMKNMGSGSLEDFLIEMSNEAENRDGLILDLRYNTGGNVHNDVLQFLRQKKYLEWRYRGGQTGSQPTRSPADKPMVLLINEQSLSDAEMTAAGFKELGLGKIIGTETYRWIIFTSAKSLVDGSGYRLPSWGCYTLAGDDLEMTGVAPDIFVKTTFKDRLDGKDPQLDRAIMEVLSQLDG